MENKQKLVTILIIVSGGILLLLVLAVSILLRSQQPPIPTTSQTETNSSIPTTVPITQVRETPVPNAAENYEQLPFTLERTFPAPLWSQLSSHVDEVAASYDIVLSRPEDTFSIAITTLSTTPGFEQKERVKYIPSPLPYNANEFIQIAEVNGQQLFVSRTGATEVMVENELGTYRSIPSLQPETDYYVYQLYQGGLSEYISAFNATQQNVPSYDNHFIIKYRITSPNDAAKWSQYQTLVAESISGMKTNKK